MITSESTAKLAPDLVKALSELENAAKSETVNTGQFTYTFAPLPDILDVVRPVLAKHGLVLVQEATSYENKVGVATRIFHTSGEWIEYEHLLLPAGQNAQSAGSAISYARRYALTAALGIAADEDDDGARASTAQAGQRSGGQPSKTSKAGGKGEVLGEGDHPTPGCAHTDTSPLKMDGHALPAGKVRCLSCGVVLKEAS